MCTLHLDSVTPFTYHYKSFTELTVPAELSARMLLWFFFTAEGSECNKGKGVTSLPASSSTYMKPDMNTKNQR